MTTFITKIKHSEHLYIHEKINNYQEIVINFIYFQQMNIFLKISNKY